MKTVKILFLVVCLLLTSFSAFAYGEEYVYESVGVYLKDEDSCEEYHPTVTKEFNGHTYSLFLNVSISWEEAREYCISIGGHLATVTSEDENNFLIDLMKNGDCSQYWLGAGIGSDGWIWITEEYFHGYTNFENSIEDTYEETQYLQIKNTDAGEWTASPNVIITEDGNLIEQNVGFICEIEATKIPYDKVSSVKIDSRDNKIKIDLDFVEEELPAPVSFAALYGGSFVPPANMDGGSVEFDNVDGDKKYTVKMFFWDDNLKPLSEPVITDIFVK